MASRIALAFATFLVIATVSTNASSSSRPAIPPFVEYLSESDLDAARKLGLERHEQAVQDALTHFPVDEIACTAEEDEAAVRNTPLQELPVRVGSQLPDFDDELQKSVFVSQKPLLTREECAQIIQMADDHFAEHGKNGEWTALPAGEYKMRGFQLKDVPAIRQFFIEVFRRRFLPIVQHTNPKFAESIADLALDNCYLMKFSPQTGARMDIHCDDGCLSFTIQMNPMEEYEGGGTWFEGLAPESDEANHAAGIVKMDVGHVHFRPGAIRHMGNTITSGKRFVIGGFAIHRHKPEYIRQLMRGNAPEQMDLALPAVVALNPDYDEGYAMLAHDWTVRAGKAKEAKEALEYCLEHVNPKCSKVAFSLGVVHYLREGQYDKVMDCMKIVLEYDPVDVKALCAMATAASELGKTDVEREMYERIVQVKTVEPDIQSGAYRDLGLLYKGKDVQKEIDCYQKAIAAQDTYHARYSLGRALFETGDYTGARESFLAAHSQAQDNAQAGGSLKALYRTANTILEKENDSTISSLSSPSDTAQKMAELVGGQENYNKIQAMMASRFGY